MKSAYANVAPKHSPIDAAPAHHGPQRVSENVAFSLSGPHRLANLVDVVQRYPVKGQDEVWRDSVFTDIVLEKIDRHVYRIQSNGKIVNYDVDMHSYYEVKGDNEPDYDKPYLLNSASSVAVAAPTHYGDIGARGKGVCHVSQDTTLSTSGLLTCVGWLLYNDDAAYLTHIVVLEPEHVLANGGIEQQVEALVELFEEKAGSQPTKVHIQVSEEQQAYDDEHELWKSGWMLELVPQSCTATWERGEADFSHIVPRKAGTRVEWSGPEISVFTGQEDERGDIHTAPNRVIPSGGIFEMEL